MAVLTCSRISPYVSSKSSQLVGSPLSYLRQVSLMPIRIESTSGSMARQSSRQRFFRSLTLFPLIPRLIKSTSTPGFSALKPEAANSGYPFPILRILPRSLPASVMLSPWKRTFILFIAVTILFSELYICLDRYVISNEN